MRCCVFLLLVVTAVAIGSEIKKGDQKCKPGELFKKYCNSCRCAEDGSDFACTTMACTAGMYNEDGTLRESFGKYNSNDLADMFFNGSKQKRDTQKPVICMPNVSFKKFCNTCICSPDGTDATCTIKRCPSAEYNPNGSRRFEHFLPDMRMKRDLAGMTGSAPCQLGTTIKKDCNYCGCGPDGTYSVCTKMLCSRSDKNPSDGTRRYSAQLPMPFGQVPIITMKMYCQPNQPFSIYCNTCRCSLDGRSATCTYRACPMGVYHEDGTRNDFMDHREPSVRPTSTVFVAMICQPNQLFKYYCNTCRCTMDGRSASCTYRTCPAGVYNEDGTVGSYNLHAMCSATCSSTCNHGGHPLGVDNEYGSGIGSWSSYRRTSGQGPTIREDIACQPNALFKRYCNTCRCALDGQSATCTYRACPAGVYNEDGTVDNFNLHTLCSASCSASCNHGGHPLGVDNEYGSGIGSWSSYGQMIGQRPMIRKEIACQPNASFRRYCNTCRCGLDGKSATCTSAICPPGVYKEDGTTVKPSPQLRIDPQACEPNKTFKKYCNICRCSADGKLATCTYKECPPGLYNEDGTTIDTLSNYVAASGNTLRIEPMICEPNKLFKKDCNSCRCSEDGKLAACTYKECATVVNSANVTKTDNSDSRTKTYGPLRVYPMDCEPNTAFRKYCNGCRCSRDGKSVACTHVECPPGVYNEDGSLIKSSQSNPPQQK